ncbi:hypothetical protein CTAYLR_010680 [Chrysophaeum taylorii]|uniref:Uncharacterized protein n=1 Tax=Chrysophaeum taylorii TaxID=2483200 RepID=A0AAD7XND7_9STRA|nr:hypothetical protein CTAYLR_010680 [Chrysophaeum taylorii]
MYVSSFPKVVAHPTQAAHVLSTLAVCDEGIFNAEAQSHVAEAVVEGVALLGGFTIASAVVLAAINLVLTLMNALAQKCLYDQFMPFDFDIGAGPATITRVRLQLAQLLALGLEILLIGDILETLTQSTEDYTFDSLYNLALVGAIRTFLSYFLGLETEEILERAKVDGRIDGRDFNYQRSLKGE